ncbi:hypothetical protein ES703_67071 [subsurface metagenome]
MELKASTGFLPRLESLRGVAAVSVVGYHVAAIYWQIIPTGLNAVVMFFVLSGFVLARSLEKNPSPGAFFLSRVYRLLPPAAAAVLLFASLYWLFGYRVGGTDLGLVNVLLNALMIKSDINSVMWSMTVECAATPLILGASWALARYGVTPLIVVCVFLFGLSFWGPYVHLLGEYTNLAPLYAFVMGVLAYGRGQDFLQLMSTRVQQVLSVGAVILMGVCAVRKQTAPVILDHRVDRIRSAHRRLPSAGFLAGPVLRADFVQLLSSASPRHHDGDSMPVAVRASAECWNHRAGHRSRRAPDPGNKLRSYG